MILFLTVVGGDARLSGRNRQQPAEIETPCFPVMNSVAHVQPVSTANHFVKGAEPKLRHQLPHFLDQEGEEVDDVGGLAREALAQFRVLRGDADRAGIQVAFPHHHTTGGNQRPGTEAKAIRAE